jgi:DNA-binding NtrC family response regulator
MSRDEAVHQTALPKVLVVDDEQRVLDSMRLMFRHRYDLLLAADSRTALDILDRHDVDVIVADREMPTVGGLELLAVAHERSPRTIGILLTDNGAVAEIAGALAEIGVFRVMHKPVALTELRIAIELAIRSLAAAPPASSVAAIDPMELLAERILAAEPLPGLAETFSDRLAGLSPPAAEQTPVESAGPTRDDGIPIVPLDAYRPAAGGAVDGTGVIVFSNDASVVDCVRRAAGERFRVYNATNVVQVVKLLDERELGVLVTDVARDRETVRSMTARLREHRPELVTIVVAEPWEAADRASLINIGLVFRFLREPVTVGRCAVSLQAAVQHLEATRNLAARPASVDTPAAEDSGTFSGVFERLKVVKRFWA